MNKELAIKKINKKRWNRYERGGCYLNSSAP